MTMKLSQNQADHLGDNFTGLGLQENLGGCGCMAYMILKELRARGFSASYVVLGELEYDDSIMGEDDCVAHVMVAVTIEGIGEYWLDTEGLKADGEGGFAWRNNVHRDFDADALKAGCNPNNGWNKSFKRTNLLKCRRKIRKVFKGLPSE